MESFTVFGVFVCNRGILNMIIFVTHGGTSSAIKGLGKYETVIWNSVSVADYSDFVFFLDNEY